MQVPLEHALLGLLQQQPRSGYDLRKVFATSPMGTFSDSPGAIYPALHRLERRGLIRGQIQDRGGLRRRRLFRLTAAGLNAFRLLQERPIARDDLAHLEAVMLRFAFMDQSLGPAASVRFLKALAAELAAHIPTLRVHLAPDMPLSARLALEHGIGDYKALLRWTRSAVLRYRGAPKGDRLS
jgi:DNA-binding PadR family transcriptional regulator